MGVTQRRNGDASQRFNLDAMFLEPDATMVKETAKEHLVRRRPVETGVDMNATERGTI